jgi:hypothetical protein
VPHLSACGESEDDVHHPHLRRVPEPRTACLSTPSSCAPVRRLTTRSGRISDAIRAHFGHSSPGRSSPSLAQQGRALVRRPLSLGDGRWSVRHPIAHMRAMTPPSWVMRASDEPTARKRAHGHDEGMKWLTPVANLDGRSRLRQSRDRGQERGGGWLNMRWWSPAAARRG